MDNASNSRMQCAYRDILLYVDGRHSYTAPQHNDYIFRPDQCGSSLASFLAIQSHEEPHVPPCGALAVRTVREPLQRRFEVMARTTPCAVAVSFNGRRLTYGELDEQADALALQLQAGGLRPCSFCLVDLEPSLAQVRVILAVLKAGAACLQFAPGIAEGTMEAALAVLRPAIHFARRGCRAGGMAAAMQTVCCDEDAADLPYGWPDELPVDAFTPAHAYVTVSVEGDLCVSVRTHQALCSVLGNGSGARGALASEPDPGAFWRPLSNGVPLTIES